MELASASKESLNKLHYIAKPAIVLSLIVFFYISAKHLDSKTKQFTLWALFFSMIGDILLMFTNTFPTFFIVGLVSFLFAHLVYIKIFHRKLNSQLKPFGFLIILLLYATGLFCILITNLGNLLIPVILYIAVILLMVTMAYLRQDRVNRNSYILVLVGAFLFIVSDSLLALNEFYKPLPFANISIMTTYALAQICIVFGIKKQQ